MSSSFSRLSAMVLVLTFAGVTACSGGDRAPINADDLEEQHLIQLTRDEVQTALLAGEFKVISWATVVALALLKLPTL